MCAVVVADLDPVGQSAQVALGLSRGGGSQLLRPELVLGVDAGERRCRPVPAHDGGHCERRLVHPRDADG
ncbi:Uncharacterised protein [Mycobacterium tuberculosis]|nr:Uncharacterised protein [Mycobacterium tuberculosis]